MTQQTIVVFGDQLNRAFSALAEADPTQDNVLIVESGQLLARRQHKQRQHLVIAAMRRFAAELTTNGFRVDYRRAPTIGSGIRAHADAFDVDQIIATEPNSRPARQLCRRLEIQTVPSNQFLCHHNDFSSWASGRRSLKLEDFYRWNRHRLGYLMDGDNPLGDRWNYDADNREPPPDDPSVFTEPPTEHLDQLDQEVINSLDGPGAEPVGLWATDRAGALRRLTHFVNHELARFGPYEDAMTTRSWHLAHSLLSPYLNLGLLRPHEVCDAAINAYYQGNIPINSAEGFIRQVIGWREYIWGLYWLWPDQAETNALNHQRALPPMFTGDAFTDMACLATTFDDLNERAWVHHIPRLMVLSNFANLYGTHPSDVMDWMSSIYIDAADWVMVPNVFGMALWADGGRTATKPYISGGAYVNRMSDYCKGCRFDPKQRVGDEACPFTTLYWDFLARHRDVLATNGRMARPLANLNRLSNINEVRQRAANVIDLVGRGEL